MRSNHGNEKKIKTWKVIYGEYAVQRAQIFLYI